MGVNSVVVAIVNIPFLRSPFNLVRELCYRIFNCAVLGTKLLSQLDSAGRAILNTAAAGNAVFGCDAGNISGTAQVGSVEEQRGSQAIADIDITVANSKDLVLAVDIGDLMHIASVFGFFHDAHDFVIVDIAAAFVGFHNIVSHVAHGNAPVFRIVGTAFVHYFA